MPSWLSKTTLKKLLDLAGFHNTTSEEQAVSHTERCTNSCPGPCLFYTGLLQCSSSWTSIMHNQTFTDDSEWSVPLFFCKPNKAHVTPFFISLHWLPVAARIEFKTLMLAYKTSTGSAPAYFHSLMTIYIPSRSLRSANERRLVVPSQRGTKSLSRTFSFTVPGWWNELPTPIRNAESLTIFKRHQKSHLFQLYLTSYKKNQKPLLPFVNFALFSLNSHRLARICSEQCLEMCITSTSFVCLPLYNVLLFVLLNCKSFWIKASAKWINVIWFAMWFDVCLCIFDS